jgi:hypothetical protein
MAPDPRAQDFPVEPDIGGGGGGGSGFGDGAGWKVGAVVAVLEPDGDDERGDDGRDVP